MKAARDEAEAKKALERLRATIDLEDQQKVVSLPNKLALKSRRARKSQKTEEEK